MSKAIEEANLFARKLKVEKKRVKVEAKVEANRVDRGGKVEAKNEEGCESDNEGGEGEGSTGDHKEHGGKLVQEKLQVAGDYGVQWGGKGMLGISMTTRRLCCGAQHAAATRV
jgi:hypothetical protein